MIMDKWQYENYMEGIEKKMKKKKTTKIFSDDKFFNFDAFVSDCLMIGVDFSPNEEDSLIVMRRVENDIYVINQFRNEEARELYNKLIGK